MEDAVAVRSIEPTLRALEGAWSRGDGSAWAQKCTEDVDFINLLGIYVKGRDAVVGMHDKIFKGPYAGSKLKLVVEHVRVLSEDKLLALVASELQIPEGPVKGIVRTIATVLIVRDENDWLVASFHNTKREATQADHTAIMLDAVSK
ncbi:MAG TPA: SgcJ/EcaC family oxidoreductase [Candidatus Cybelea sp.]